MNPPTNPYEINWPWDGCDTAGTVALWLIPLMLLHGRSRDVTVKLLQDWGGVDTA